MTDTAPEVGAPGPRELFVRHARRDGRSVALKELVFTQVPSSASIESFEREGRILQQLRHPQIPRFVATFSEGTGVAAFNHENQ